MADGIVFFFDTYALVELYEGNLNYAKFEDVKIVTSDFNLYETYYILRKKNPQRNIDDYFNQLKKFSIRTKYEWIKKAVDFRLKNKSKKLSYVDCLGYVMAKEMKSKFLTGDNQFQNMENVEFVK